MRRTAPTLSRKGRGAKCWPVGPLLKCTLSPGPSPVKGEGSYTPRACRIMPRPETIAVKAPLPSRERGWGEGELHTESLQDYAKARDQCSKSPSPLAGEGLGRGGTTHPKPAALFQCSRQVQ